MKNLAIFDFIQNMFCDGQPHIDRNDTRNIVRYDVLIMAAAGVNDACFKDELVIFNSF